MLKSLKLYGSSHITVIIQIISHVLAYTNSCVNPVLYAFLSDNFRKAFRKVSNSIEPTMFVLNFFFFWHKSRHSCLKLCVCKCVCDGFLLSTIFIYFIQQMLNDPGIWVYPFCKLFSSFCFLISSFLRLNELNFHIKTRRKMNNGNE